MTGYKRVLCYMITIAVVAALAALGVFFISRSARRTVHIQDYALELGSSDFFICNNSNLYKISVDKSPDYVYVRYHGHDDTVIFQSELNDGPASELSPLELAYTYRYGYLRDNLFVRGDGSIWVKDYKVASGADRYIRLVPYFTEVSTEEWKPVEGHEINLLTLDSYGRLRFSFAGSLELSHPKMHLSVQLEDGKWYRLDYHSIFYSDYYYSGEANAFLHYAEVNLPAISGVLPSILRGNYRIEIYENAELYTALEFKVEQESTQDAGVNVYCDDFSS